MLPAAHYNSPKEPNKVLTLYEDSLGAFKWILLTQNSSLNYFSNENREIVISCLKSSCTIRIKGEGYKLNVKDVIYIPPGSERIDIRTNKEESLVVIGEGESDYKGKVYVKRFNEVSPIESGYKGYRRYIYVLIGENDPGKRLLAGFTEGMPGEWTSYPPHKHDDKLEIYVYYGLKKGFGIQIVEDEEKFTAFKVKDYDAVIFHRGYHPNVPSPGSKICYLWILCQKEGKKNLSVEIHPEYKDIPIGKTHLKRD